MAGVRQKAPELLANSRGGRGRGLVVAVPDQARKPPRLPAPSSGLTWGKVVKRSWAEFWKSPVSTAVDLNADGERLFRWMEAQQEREDLLARIREDGYVVPWGPFDQKIAHPLLVHTKHLDREIARLAEHFGATPLSRFRLQITYADAKSSEISLRQRLMREDRREAESSGAKIIDLDSL